MIKSMDMDMIAKPLEDLFPVVLISVYSDSDICQFFPSCFVGGSVF